MTPEQEHELYLRKSQVVQKFYGMFAQLCRETRGGEVDFDGVCKIVSTIADEIANVNQPPKRATKQPKTVDYKTDRTVTVSNPMIKRTRRTNNGIK